MKEGDIMRRTLCITALLLLAVHRGEASPVWGLLTGRIRLRGRRRLFLLFPRLFPTEAPRRRLRPFRGRRTG